MQRFEPPLVREGRPGPCGRGLVRGVRWHECVLPRNPCEVRVSRPVSPETLAAQGLDRSAHSFPSHLLNLCRNPGTLSLVPSPPALARMCTFPKPAPHADLPGRESEKACCVRTRRKCTFVPLGPDQSELVPWHALTRTLASGVGMNVHFPEARAPCRFAGPRVRKGLLRKGSAKVHIRSRGARPAEVTPDREPRLRLPGPRHPPPRSAAPADRAARENEKTRTPIQWLPGCASFGCPPEPNTPHRHLQGVISYLIGSPR